MYRSTVSPRAKNITWSGMWSTETECLDCPWANLSDGWYPSRPTLIITAWSLLRSAVGSAGTPVSAVVGTGDPEFASCLVCFPTHSIVVLKLFFWPCWSRERLWIVVDSKRRYSIFLNELMNELVYPYPIYTRVARVRYGSGTHFTSRVRIEHDLCGYRPYPVLPDRHEVSYNNFEVSL